MGADEMAGIFGCRNDRRAEAVHLLFPPVLSSIGHHPALRPALVMSAISCARGAQHSTGMNEWGE